MLNSVGNSRGGWHGVCLCSCVAGGEMSQCPSCGCDCGYTKKGGCRQIVMVPREPTEEMVLNGVRAFQHAYSETDVLEDWKDCYRAMIAMAPPRREWVGLTDEEISQLYIEHAKYQEEGMKLSGWGKFAADVQAKLQEKNT
jgi:hypothetical protein